MDIEDIKSWEQERKANRKSEGAREREVQFNYSNEVYREQQGELYIYLYDIVYPI